MNAPSKFEAPKPSTSELLSLLISTYAELQSRGDLADAPTDLLNGLDAGDDAARELLEWLGEREPACMSYEDWTGASSYLGVL